MNNIDEMIGRAIGILNKQDEAVKIVKKDKNGEEYIEKSFRGQISSFGAAVQMGSLTSAVAFYSAQGGAKTDRSKLMNAIYLLVTGKDKVEKGGLLRLVVDKEVTKQQVIDAAVAIKLAMNAYDLRKDDGKKAGEES